MAITAFPYSTASIENGKLRIVFDSTLEPLTFYKVDGNELVELTPESYENINGTKTYLIPADNSDIIKCVAGGIEK